MTTSNGRLVSHLRHDLNEPTNAAGFYSVQVPAGADVLAGDEVVVGDDQVMVRGRVRIIIAVVEPIPGSLDVAL